MAKAFSGRHIYAVSFILLLVLLLLERLIILLRFSFVYSDADQVLMWYGTREFMHGRFHEPCFFGQNYNTMLESLLSVPFFAAGFPVYYIMPVVTSVLALFPFLFFATITYSKKHYLAACAILALALVLPNEYSMLSSMPRGFVTGIFCASFGTLAYFNYRTKWTFLAAGFFLTLSLGFNPNSVVLAAPIAFYIWLNEIKNTKFYVYFLLGVLPAALLIFLAHNFYVVHSEYNMHLAEPLAFSWHLLIGSFTYLNEFFDGVTPFSLKGGWPLLLQVFIVFCILAYQEKYFAAFSLLAGLTIIILAMGFNKVHDGTDSLFFSLYRMYLAVPALMALSISKIHFKHNYWLFPLLILPLVALYIKWQKLDDDIAYNTSFDRYHIVSITQIPSFINECAELKKLCDDTQADILVLYQYSDVATYGCPVLVKDFPPTLRPDYDRRTWILKQEDTSIRKNVLILSHDTSAMNCAMEVEPRLKRLEHFPGAYLLNNNKLPTIALLNRININVRKF